jgi:serine/threonine protein kinase
MGEIYLAEDTSLDQNATLKSLPPSLQQDVAAHEPLSREAKSAATLHHPYICTIHEVAASILQSFDLSSLYRESRPSVPDLVADLNSRTCDQFRLC